MNSFPRPRVVAAFAAACLTSLAAPAEAGIGDLLVAPTRIVLDGRKGAEVILNNIGDEPATYRVSVVFRRMTEDGGLQDVAEPDASDKAAEDMILYQPRKVVLPPRQPQAIRIIARAPQGLPDGEYRVHLLFRAIPPAIPVAAAAANESVKGIQFRLTPVYGVTIPVIVRLGNLEATAGIANVHLDKVEGKQAVALDLSRSGSRSTYGEVRVFKAGIKDPIAIQKNVAVYTEINRRHVAVALDEAYKGAVAGPVTVQYVETFDDGSHVIAETQAVLR
jgi:P pilus assembly chaperone PapD